MDRIKTVVVGVTDEEISQALYHHLGNRSTVALKTARHLEDILISVLDGKADVVVLDLDFPGASTRTVEVLRRAGPSLVLVVLAPDQDLKQGREVLRHNVFYFATKPAPEAEVLESVDHALAYREEKRVSND